MEEATAAGGRKYAELCALAYRQALAAHKLVHMAGNRIKGITVEIGGDTTKLQTALKGVNTEIRNTQSQLRDVEKLLPVTGVAADMVISPQMAAADSGVITGTGTSGGADLTAGIVAALKEVLGDQKGQQGDLVIPVYLGNQLLDEVIVTAQQRMSLRSGGR